MAAAGFTALRADPVIKDIKDLKPGEYTWHPERSPAGPVAVIVSLSEQRVHVYRNGIRIAVSTCSTGKPGHETPVGVFTILQKDRHHHSNLYNNAPMPNMVRLTWSGIALHAGKLPGYPASHGCVRLPMEFSARLFEITLVGTAVIVANDHEDPVAVAHPGMVLSAEAESRFDAALATLATKQRPGAVAATAPVSVIVSGSDRRVHVLENGHTVLDGPVRIASPEVPLGSHVFILAGFQSGAMQWHGIGHSGNEADAATSSRSVLDRLAGNDDVVQRIAQLIHPGMVLVTTDLPLTPDRHSGRDFVVISTEDA